MVNTVMSREEKGREIKEEARMNRLFSVATFLLFSITKGHKGSQGHVTVWWTFVAYNARTKVNYCRKKSCSPAH